MNNRNKHGLFFTLILAFFMIMFIGVVFPAEVGAAEGDPFIGSGTSSNNAFTSFGFEPYDIEIDPDRAVAYSTAKNEEKLYRVDLSTGEISYMEFTYEASRIAVRGGKIYLMLPHTDTKDGAHIAVIDTATFSLTNYFEIDKYPLDIEVDNQGNVYVAYKSGYNISYLASYDSATGTFIDESQDIAINSFLIYNSEYNRIYAVNEELYYHYNGYVYQLNDGMISAPYTAAGNEHVDTRFMELTQDDDYLISIIGNIYRCNAMQSEDMQYYDTIEHCSIMYDDIANDTLYTARYYTLLTYEFSSLTVVSQFYSESLFVDILNVNDELMFIQENSLGVFFLTTNPVISPSNVPATGVQIDETSITSIVGKEEFLTETVLPSDATNQYVLWSSSNPAVASVDNEGNVLSLSPGTCVITCTTMDGGYTDSCTITVLDEPLLGTYTSAANGLIDLGFIPNDVAITADGLTAYMTEADGNNLYKVNLTTGEISYMEFFYKAEKLTIKNGNVYLTLLHRDRSLISDHASGTVVVVDAAAFTYLRAFNVIIDPFDIAADVNGHVYLSPGTNAAKYLVSYDANTGMLLDTVASIIRQTINYNEQYNRLYTMFEVFSGYLYSYEVSNGTFGTEYNRKVHDYDLTSPIGISPDGEYLFHGAGHVFTCDNTDETDLLYFDKVEEFSSICFNIGANAFYTVMDNNLLTYAYNTQTIEEHFISQDDFFGVYYKNNQLIYLQKNDLDKYFFTDSPVEETNTIPANEIVLDETSITTMPERLHQLTETVLPENTSSKYVKWTSSDASIATVKNGLVQTHAIGTCQITCTVINGEASAFCTINVLATPDIGKYTSSYNGLDNLGFNPLDVEIDPDRDVVYLTDNEDSNKLYRVDLSTGEIQYIEFIYNTKQLTAINGKIYLLLPHGQSTLNLEGESATVAILDTATFTVTGSFDIDFDPYDIAADTQGYVYISPDSIDHSAEMISYNSSTGEAVCVVSGMDYCHILDYSETYNKLYSLCMGLHPTDFDGYELSNGVITNYYDSPYHGDYDFSRDMELSSDGQYIFNKAGYILTSAPTKTGDMIYLDKIEEFTSVCFDLDNNIYYTSYRNSIRVCDYSTFSVISSYVLEDKIVDIFFVSGDIVAMQKNTDEEYYFNTVDENDYVSPYSGSGSTPNDAFSNIGFTPLDVIVDTDRNAAYLTESGSNRLYRTDLQTGQITYLEFIYRAERMTLMDGKIYLTLPHKPHVYYGDKDDESGTIAVINADTFKFISSFDVWTDPFDIEADNNGHLFVGPGSNQWSPVKSYDADTGECFSTATAWYYCKWDYNYKYNKLYTIRRNSPNIMTSYETNEGIFTGSYSDPYHSLTLTSDITISPDGDYVFNGYGNIFTCSQTQDDDMILYNTIEKFNFVCFDTGNNLFYTAKNNVLKEYEYSTQTLIKTYTLEDEIINIFFSGESLYSVRKNVDQEYYIDVIDQDDFVSPYISTGISPENALVDLGFEPVDVEIDPDKAVAYLTEVDGYRLYRADLATGEITYIEFEYIAERLSVKNGKIYLTLLHRPHSAYATIESGTIVVINAETFSFEYSFETPIDPYDIAADSQGHVYIAPGSHQWSSILSYVSDTGELLSELTSISYLSFIEYNDVLNRLYSLDTTIGRIEGFQVVDGKAFNNSDTSNQYYNGNCQLIKISPDGDYLYCNDGDILTNDSNVDSDLILDSNIDNFSSICFDLDNNNFYTSKNNEISVYTYDTQTIEKQYTDINDFVEIFYSSNTLTALKKNESNVYYFDTTTGTGINVTDITIEENAQLNVGSTLQLNPVIAPEDATNKTVCYTSSDESIASVNVDGVVSGVSPGIVTITVTTQDCGLSAVCTVDVLQPVTGVELTEELEMDVNDTVQLTATIMPSDATNKNVSYSSSNEDVATVDSAGLITAHSEGGAIITVTTEDGGYTDMCEVTVLPPVSGVELSSESFLMKINDTIIVSATVYPSNASNKTVVFSSSDESVATVDETGLIYTHASGISIITAITEDGGYTDETVVVVYNSDVNADSHVDLLDITLVAQNYNTGNSEHDLNKDNICNLFDLILVSINLE